MTIILGILKLILIILLVLLAAALVLVLLILFVPVRYSIKGSFINEVPDAGAEIRWLHGALSAKAAYTKEGGIKAYINAFGHKIYDILGDEDEAPEDITAENECHFAGRDTSQDIDNTDISSKQDYVKSETGCRSDGRSADDIRESIEEQSSQHEEQKVQTGFAKDGVKLTKAGADAAANEHSLKISVYSTNPLSRLRYWLRVNLLTKPGLMLRRAADKISRITDAAELKLRAIFESLREAAKAAKAAFDKRSSQLKKLKALWEDKRFASCKALLLDRAVKLLLEIKPRSGSGYVRIGRDDPYSTAQAMQLAAFLYPFYADTIKVIPDFDQSILEGELDIGGRIRLIIPAEAAIRIFFNKELRLMYRKARHILELD